MQTENSDDSFIISRTFEASVARLFNVWINPDIYTSWMGPAGAEMSFLCADVREGGTALWKMTTIDGLTKYGKLHYKTIRLNQRLSYVQNFCDQHGNFMKAPFSQAYPDSLLLTVDFNEEKDNKVRMVVKWEIVGPSTGAERRTFNDMRPFMVQGWNESFDKIDKLLR